jgi:hypothetical protein
VGAKTLNIEEMSKSEKIMSKILTWPSAVGTVLLLCVSFTHCSLAAEDGSPPSHSQSSGQVHVAATSGPGNDSPLDRPFSAVGIALEMSTAGAGIEVATPLSWRWNLRAGFNTFNYSEAFTTDGINYDAKARLRSVSVFLDWFPLAGGFHISPGVWIYNGNKASAILNVPQNQAITLNDVDYYTNPADPIKGTGKLTFHTVSPGLEVGWGNLIPRFNKRWSIPVELGFVYHGTPALQFDLTGSACTSRAATSCSQITTDPTIQSNLNAQRRKLQKNVAPYRFFPIMSIGFGYRF